MDFAMAIILSVAERLHKSLDISGLDQWQLTINPDDVPCMQVTQWT